MSLEIEKRNNALIVRVYGEFDLRAAEFHRHDIDEKLKTKGAKHLIFNLGGLTFIDSSGLGVILGRYRKVTENGGRVLITNVPSKFNRILELSGINRLIPIYDDEDEALKELA